jgi:hypothetical protein
MLLALRLTSTAKVAAVGKGTPPVHVLGTFHLTTVAKEWPTQRMFFAIHDTCHTPPCRAACMVGKNDIIGDLESLNDIINDIIFIIGRKMISFFPSSLAGQWSCLRRSQRDHVSRRHDHGLRRVVRSSRVLAGALARHSCVRRVLPPAGHGGANLFALPRERGALSRHKVAALLATREEA